jgi:hypothetical protein
LSVIFEQDPLQVGCAEHLLSFLSHLFHSRKTQSAAWITSMDRLFVFILALFCCALAYPSGAPTCDGALEAPHVPITYGAQGAFTLTGVTGSYIPGKSYTLTLAGASFRGHVLYAVQTGTATRVGSFQSGNNALVMGACTGKFSFLQSFTSPFSSPIYLNYEMFFLKRIYHYHPTINSRWKHSIIQLDCSSSRNWTNHHER